MAVYWIWQQPDWPDFNWDAERLAPLLRECVQAQGQLMGMASSVDGSMSAQSELDALLQNIVTSSAIEGEQLNVGSVRSSLARRLGLELHEGDRVSRRSEGLAQLLLDATQHFAQPVSGVLNRASVPPSIKRWQKCPRPRQPVIWRSYWQKVA